MFVPLKVSLVYVPKLKEWHLLSRTSGNTLQEFKDTKKIREFFVGCSKVKEVHGTLMWKSYSKMNVPYDTVMDVTVLWEPGTRRWIVTAKGLVIERLLDCGRTVQFFVGAEKMGQPIRGYLGWKLSKEGDN